MSNAGQAVLSIGGAIVGSFIPGVGTALGFTIGSTLGQALFPTDLGNVSGPRLDDLRVQTSTIGAPIPLVYGTYAISGNVIWSSGIIETETQQEQGGKGGPTQTVTTYSYMVNCAVGVCEGPIGAITRIWADAELIYDSRPQQPNEGDIEYNERVAATALLSYQIAMYLGAETQLPDPVIESYEGEGNVSGFRGLAYVVFYEFQLANYGNRVPNFRFEVQSQELQCTTALELSNEVLYPWLDADYPVSVGNTYTIDIRSTGLQSRPPGTYSTVEDAVSAIVTYRGKPFGVYLGHSLGIAGAGLEPTNRMGGPTAFGNDPIEVTLHYNSDFPTAYTADYTTQCAMMQSVGGVIGTIVHMKGGHGGTSGYSMNLIRAYGAPVADGYDAEVSCTSIPTTVSIRYDGLVDVRREPGPPTGDDWQLSMAPFQVLQAYAYAGNPPLVTQYPLNPTLGIGDPNDTQAFWEAAYNAAVTAGTMQAGLTYGVDYPVTVDYAYYRNVQTCVVPPGQITLGEIVRDICERSGLAPEQIDVSELTETVDGYAVGRPMTGRDAIAPLRTFGWFDCVESDGQLTWPLRGRAISATLVEDDLAAHPAGESRPSNVDVRRLQEVELPRRVRVHYAQAAKNYEAGEQSASRLAAGEVQVVDVEVPISMSDQKAAQIAEVLLYDRWISRNSYSFSLDHSWLALNPADVVTLPVDGRQERVRLTAISHAMPGVLRLDGVRDDDGVYVSYAVGTPAIYVGNGSGQAVSGATNVVALELLDLPLLRDEADDAGYYAAVRSVSGTFRGAGIYRSADGGVTYTQVGEATSTATTGTVASALPAGPTTIIDYENELLVELDSGTLSSVVMSSLLNGANAAAIGADGRWEVVQFMNAVDEGGSPPTWRLSGLLRGRRGTEFAIGQSQTGDRFVLLDSALVRLGMNASGIGALRRHRAVPAGGTLDAATTVDFVPMGASLKPFSVVYVSGSRDGGGDLTIEFIRRGRIGQELRDGRDIALSEASESYECDVLASSTDDTVLRTLTSTIQSFTYTDADATADFGSPVPATVRVRIYQLSANVGRGYLTEATV